MSSPPPPARAAKERHDAARTAGAAGAGTPTAPSRDALRLRAWRERNPGKAAAYERAWRARHPEKAAQRQAARARKLREKRRHKMPRRRRSLTTDWEALGLRVVRLDQVRDPKFRVYSPSTGWRTERLSETGPDADRYKE